jgi:hypothetical protein
MLHLTTDPTWSTPDNYSDNAFIAVWVGAPALLVCVVIALVLVFRKRYGAAGNFGGAAVMVAMLTCCAAAGISMFGYNAASTSHDATVTSWLRDTYGAVVDAERFELGDGSIQETTATVGGKPVVIKLARTPEDHIAVFTTDDKPLPRRAH